VSSIAENLERVKEQIANACARSGRNPDEIALVAVTKTHPAERVREARENSRSAFERALAFHWSPAKEQDPPSVAAV
jgi:PLP dependent protein